MLNIVQFYTINLNYSMWKGDISWILKSHCSLYDMTFSDLVSITNEKYWVSWTFCNAHKKCINLFFILLHFSVVCMIQFLDIWLSFFVLLFTYLKQQWHHAKFYSRKFCYTHKRNLIQMQSQVWISKEPYHNSMKNTCHWKSKFFNLQNVLWAHIVTSLTYKY